MSVAPLVTRPSRAAVADTLVAAAWFGLVTGLVEGAAFLFFADHGGLIGVPPEILAITPLFDLLLFGVVGLAIVGALRRWPRLPAATGMFVFSFVALLDWMAVAANQRLHAAALVLLAAGLSVQLSRWYRPRAAVCHRVWRRSLPWVALLAGGALVVTVGGRRLREQRDVAQLPVAPAGTPNVLVVVVDTLRADHLSSYGYARPTSPNVDRLAQQGVLFENAYATSGYTLPSHASLLTGRYLHEHGVDWHTPRALRQRSLPTLAEALRGAGFRTAAVSANLFWFTRSQAFGRGFIRFDDYFYSVGDMALRTLYGRAVESMLLRRPSTQALTPRKRADDVNRAALAWMARDRSRPFFLFLNYMDVHDPYLPPQPYRSRFSPSSAPGGLLNGHRVRALPQLTPEQVQSEIDAYDGGLAYVDESIGRLLAAMQELGVRDNTLVVFTSDHGEAFGEHGLFLHGNALYRCLTHVPLIIWWPGHVPAGVRVVRPVTNAALAATLMDLLEVHQTAPFPIASVRPLWSAPLGDAPWPFPLSEMTYTPWTIKRFPIAHGPMKALVTPQWHLIWNRTLGLELYDWRADPSESRNLAAEPDAQPAVLALQAELDAIPWVEPGPRAEGPGER